MARKGIILAGGSGTRLYPVTHVVSKQLLPVYDKPMIYYPLSTLMLAGIRDDPDHLARRRTRRASKRLLGDGSQWGMNIQYAVQPSPDGLAQAFIIGREFVGNDPSALILGDNIFYGHDLAKQLERADEQAERRDRVRLSRAGPGALRRGRIRRAVPRVVASKRSRPGRSSNYAVTGLYFYDKQVVRHRRGHQAVAARRARNHRRQLALPRAMAQLNVEIMGRGYAWLDTGTHDSLIEAASSSRRWKSARG